MKRFFITAISLSLLLLLAGLAGAASLTVNLVGKYEGTAQVVRGSDYSSVGMVVRILTQNGALFSGSVTMLDKPDTSTFNGALYDGGFRITGNEMVGDGKYHPSAPPYLSGCFQSLSVTGDASPQKTGVFYLKRTSTNPNAP